MHSFNSKRTSIGAQTPVSSKRANFATNGSSVSKKKVKKNVTVKASPTLTSANGALGKSTTISKHILSNLSSRCLLTKPMGSTASIGKYTPLSPTIYKERITPSSVFLLSKKDG